MSGSFPWDRFSSVNFPNEIDCKDSLLMMYISFSNCNNYHDQGGNNFDKVFYPYG